jgi:Trypsin-like peptidase domain
MIKRMGSIAVLILICTFFISCISAKTELKEIRPQSEKISSKDRIPIASPMTTDLAGKSGNVAIPSVLRVLCPSKHRSGTGFLHKSGKFITAGHVVAGCTTEEMLVVSLNGKLIHVSDFKIDEDLDLALLTLVEKLNVSTLSICQNDEISIGAQVSTWGFPSGYNGMVSLLSSGYISGIDHIKTKNKKMVRRLVVNAAFNRGNSGGPLIEIENGTVIGVVSSKLAPLPQYIEGALKALKKTKYGMMYEKTLRDGSKEKVSEAQVLEEILQYLRSQTQLVIGYAVLQEDLKTFLKLHGIEP